MEDEAEESYDEAEDDLRPAKKEKDDEEEVKEKQKPIRLIITEASEDYTLTWKEIVEKLPQEAEAIAADPTLINWYKNKKRSPAVKAA